MIFFIKALHTYAILAFINNVQAMYAIQSSDDQKLKTNDQTNIRLEANIFYFFVSESEINRYKIFNYLNQSAILSNQSQNYYIDRMVDLKNSIDELNNSNDSNDRKQYLSKTLGSCCNTILEQVWKKYVEINKEKSDDLNYFNTYYMNLFFNNIYVNGKQMLNEFKDILLNRYNENVEERRMRSIAYLK